MERCESDNIAVISSVWCYPFPISVYVMGDRLTEVNHPVSGITSFIYDPLGNVLTKQTANVAEEGKMKTNTYDYHRLTPTISKTMSSITMAAATPSTTASVV